jgi:glyoxylase-like metal-dependent hydrolase (beta-lactamase superfamily II)
VVCPYLLPRFGRAENAGSYRAQYEPFLLEGRRFSPCGRPQGEELLIAGDNLVAEGTTWIGRPDGDMALYMDSLRKAKQLKLAIVGPGHGEWIQHPYEHIDFVLNRRILREKQILSLLEEHDQLKVESLTKLIYDGSIHPSIFEVAKRTTEAHLEKLRDEGKVLFKDPLYALSQM